MTDPIETDAAQLVAGGCNLSPQQMDALAAAYVRLLLALGGDTWDFSQVVSRADKLLGLRISARLAQQEYETAGLLDLLAPATRENLVLEAVPDAVGIGGADAHGDRRGVQREAAAEPVHAATDGGGTGTGAG